MYEPMGDVTQVKFATYLNIGERCNSKRIVNVIQRNVLEN